MPYPVRSPAMPTTPFRSEHEALAASVRGLVQGPLAEAAEAAERGEAPLPQALVRCRDVGLFDLAGDALAVTAAAWELGRLRSAGLARMLLDTILTSDLGLDPLDGYVAVAADAQVEVTADGASAHLPFVAGAAAASRCLVLDSGVVVELAGATVAALADAHALRGSAPAAVTLAAAPFERLVLDAGAVSRWELARAAAAVSGAWRTWEDACGYAAQRHAFGRPIARFQVNRHALAAAATKLTAAEALVHDTAAAFAAGAGADTAVPLLYAATTAAEVADCALQLHGGNGYTSAFDVSRAWRDAREASVRSVHLRRRVARTQGRP